MDQINSNTTTAERKKGAHLSMCQVLLGKIFDMR